MWTNWTPGVHTVYFEGHHIVCDGNKKGIIKIEAIISGRKAKIVIEDYGKGIEDIDKAREPLYTSRPDLERSGMGFTVMESFMDTLIVESKKGKGTKIIMTKKFS